MTRKTGCIEIKNTRTFVSLSIWMEDILEPMPGQEPELSRNPCGLNDLLDKMSRLWSTCKIYEQRQDKVTLLSIRDSNLERRNTYDVFRECPWLMLPGGHWRSICILELSRNSGNIKFSHSVCPFCTWCWRWLVLVNTAWLEGRIGIPRHYRNYRCGIPM